MTQHDVNRLLEPFHDLPEAVQAAIAPYLIETRIIEIVEARAHGVTEYEVHYLKKDRPHELVWDATTGKLLGGTDKRVIRQVIAALSDSGRKAVSEGGEKIRALKIKHANGDDREYLHVHYRGKKGRLSHLKLELDGQPTAA